MYRFRIFLSITLFIFIFFGIGRYASALPIFEDVYFFTERVEWMPGEYNWGYQFGGLVYDDDNTNNIVYVTSQDLINGNTYSLSLDEYEWGLDQSSVAAPELTQMKITATNNAGQSSDFITNLINPILLDYATNINTSGDILAPNISWDAVENAEFYRIIIYEGSSEIFNSLKILSSDFADTSYQLPTDYLEAGKEYRIRISASDYQEGILMNRSSALYTYSTSPSAVPEPSSALLFGFGILWLASGLRKVRPE